MLKRATSDDFKKITELCDNSIIGTRILCYATAYGFDREFLEIYLIEDEIKTVGVFARFYDDAAIIIEDNTDIEQISAFLQMITYKTLMCSAALCEKLGFTDKTVKNGYKFTGNANDFLVRQLYEEDYEAAYTLISKEIPGSFSNEREAYLSFLSDFTFRQRRNLARGVCTHTDGMLSSVALTSSETEKCAVISGVACNRKLQKKGIGKKTVLSLVKLLTDINKTAFVIALNESAEGFYEHIGFTETEKIAFIEREKDV